MSNGKRIVDAMHEAARFEAIRTHARSILEGEGQEEHDPALLEAVALTIANMEAEESTRGWCEPLGALSELDELSQAYYLRLARAALSTIRKHQAGE